MGLWEQSVGVLRDMEEMNLKPNAMSFSAAINACARRNQWKCALHLLEEMRQRS